MHFDMLPTDTRNEDAIREYERAENRRVRRWLVRIFIALAVLALLVWLFFRFL